MPKHPVRSLFVDLPRPRKIAVFALATAWLLLCGWAIGRVVAGDQIFLASTHGGGLQLPVTIHGAEAEQEPWLTLDVPASNTDYSISTPNGSLSDGSSEHLACRSDEDADSWTELLVPHPQGIVAIRCERDLLPGSIHRLTLRAECRALPPTASDGAAQPPHCPSTVAVRLDATYASVPRRDLEIYSLGFTADDTRDQLGPSADVESRVRPRDCRPGWDHAAPDNPNAAGRAQRCAQAMLVLGTPDIARTPRIDQWLIEWSLYFRANLIPGVMALMFATLIACVLFSMVAVINLLIPPRSAFLRRTDIYIETLTWIESTGPALGFVLTVVGLASAFRATSGVNGLGSFGNAISIALASTLCGLLIRVFAHFARSAVQNYQRMSTDEEDLELYPGSVGEFVAETRTAKDSGSSNEGSP